MSEAHVLFRAGGHSFAVASSAIGAIHDDLPLQEVGDTRDWFIGLAVAHGELLPVTDFGKYLGLAASKGRTLGINADLGMGALRIDEVIGVDKQPTVADTATLPQQLEPFAMLFNYALDAESGEHWVVDLPRLFQSETFISIGAAE